MLTTPAPAPTVDRLHPWGVHAARLLGIRSEIPDVATYELALEDPDVRSRYRFRPGQFNMLYLPGIGESAISLSSDPGRPERLLHTVREVGNVTRALARRAAGDQILIRGPFGSWWPLEECRGADLVMAAGGLGLAPLRPVLYHLVRHRSDYGATTLLYGARRPRDLLYASEYDAWRTAGIEVLTTVDFGDDAWQGNIGVVPALFERLTLDPARTRVFTCGPEIMMRFVIFESISRRVSPRHVFLSLERNMNCAVGFCGHCQLGPAFLCKNGPVFSYEQMRPYLDIEDF